jgi:hypothetical protein
VSATAIPYREIARGESFKPVGHFQTEQGVDLDASDVNVTVQLRMIPQRGGTVVTRTKGVGTEVVCPYGGSNAKAQFVFSADEIDALDDGEYLVEITWRDTTADPDDVVIAGRTRLRIYTPATVPI